MNQSEKTSNQQRFFLVTAGIGVPVYTLLILSLIYYFVGLLVMDYLFIMIVGIFISIYSLTMILVDLKLGENIDQKLRRSGKYLIFVGLSFVLTFLTRTIGLLSIIIFILGLLLLFAYIIYVGFVKPFAYFSKKYYGYDPLNSG